MMDSPASTLNRKVVMSRETSSFKLMGTMKGNFWDDYVYRRAVRRIEDSIILCDELSRMVYERAVIEKRYAEVLKTWSKKWENKIERNAELSEGTLRPAWRALLDEADSISAVHSHLHARLINEVQKEVLKWKKENFHKSVMTWKEVKLAEMAFEKAQKPWIRNKQKVIRSKKRYHGKCRELELCEKKLTEMQQAKDKPEEEITKLKEKKAKLTAEVAACKDKYSDRLQQLSADQPRYQQEMKTQFEKCQDFEQRRMDFFKRTLFSYQAILNRNYGDTWKDLRDVIAEVNSDSDLVKYASVLGPGMPFFSMQFVDYGAEDSPQLIRREVSKSQMSRMSQMESDEDWDEHQEIIPPPSNDAVGTPVRALYDYCPEEEGELGFSAGDIITQLEDEDDQGWCRGLHPNGTYGLFPASYVEYIE